MAKNQKSNILNSKQRKPNVTLPKYPAWAPRPITKVIQGKYPRLMVFEPRTRILAGFDLTDSRIPLIHLSNEDDTVLFEIDNNEPRFEIKTKTGKLFMNIDGLQIKENGKTEKYTWKDKKEIVKILANLALKDEVYRSLGVDLGRGLKIAVSATRGAGHSIGGIGSSLEGGYTVPGGFIPQQLTETIPICTVLNVGESIIEEAVSAGVKTVECTQEVIENIIEECINPIPDCLNRASQRRDECRRRCNRRYRRYYNKWMRPICKAACWVVYGVDAAICLAKALICTLIVTVETVWHCVTKTGLASPEEPPQTGDIRLYKAEGAIGSVIDFATCGYGYSHATLVCGDKMINARAEGVKRDSLDHYGDRKFAVVRLGLTNTQYEQLCACVQEKIGSDYDHLEAVTFGTIDDPGREMCTMLIMHCLDLIGVDREALGLGGFVSPNDLARVLGAPRA